MAAREEPVRSCWVVHSSQRAPGRKRFQRAARSVDDTVLGPPNPRTRPAWAVGFRVETGPAPSPPPHLCCLSFHPSPGPGTRSAAWPPGDEDGAEEERGVGLHPAQRHSWARLVKEKQRWEGWRERWGEGRGRRGGRRASTRTSVAAPSSCRCQRSGSSRGPISGPSRPGSDGAGSQRHGRPRSVLRG